MNIQKAYNDWSEIYDSNLNKTRDLDKQITMDVLSKITFDNVLELGCGTGKNTQFLVQRAKQVVAVDFSQGMLDIAIAKIKGNNISFHQVDLNQDWTFTDEKFDLLLCNLVLEHIENLDFIFKKVKEKLEKKGYFFVSELHPFKQYLGTKARFETASGINELDVFTHHISDFTKAAFTNGFKMVKLNEWWHKTDNQSVPRLVSFLFQLD